MVQGDPTAALRKGDTLGSEMGEAGLIECHSLYIIVRICPDSNVIGYDCSSHDDSTRRTDAGTEFPGERTFDQSFSLSCRRIGIILNAVLTDSLFSLHLSQITPLLRSFGFFVAL